MPERKKNGVEQDYEINQMLDAQLIEKIYVLEEKKYKLKIYRTSPT